MRKLTLRKDTLVELSSAELGEVAGAGSIGVCLTDPCITRPVTGLFCLFDDTVICLAP